MATTMKLTIALCLVAVSCIAMSKAFRLSINDHLIKSCLGFDEKKRGEGNRCNSEVIDHVHDFAEGVNGGAGYNGDMVESYLDMANGHSLCYLEGSEVKPVKNSCTAMELVCDAFNPKVVDICSRVKATVPPSTTLPVTTQGPITQAPTTAAPAPTV